MNTLSNNESFVLREKIKRILHDYHYKDLSTDDAIDQVLALFNQTDILDTAILVVGNNKATTIREFLKGFGPKRIPDKEIRILSTQYLHEAFDLWNTTLKEHSNLSKIYLKEKDKEQGTLICDEFWRDHFVMLTHHEKQTNKVLTFDEYKQRYIDGYRSFGIIILIKD